MNDNWKAFLEQTGARMEADRVIGFSTPDEEARAAVEGDVIADLSHFGLLRVTGDDAQSFLHNQFTNDVRQVTADHSQLSGYCTAKGRMLSVFRLFRRDDAYLLRMPLEILEPFAKKLRMFVLMSKVNIEDVSEELVRFGISGPNAEITLRKVFDAVPEAIDDTSQQGAVSLMRTPGPHPRFELYGPAAEMEQLWNKLAGSCRPVGEDAWALLDIRAGIPTVFQETMEAFVPQMANLQLIGGVSFKKGCYPGQEVVARMQYLGNLKRRMFIGHTDSSERPSPGEALHSASCQSGQGPGKVVDARPAPGGGFDLLAVVQIDCAEADDLHLQGDSGPRITLTPLPYSIETGSVSSAS